jgi:CRP-like cAMP-binding protein
MYAISIYQEHFDKLRALPFTAEMTDAQCEHLALLMESRKLVDNEYLLWEGRLDNRLHVVTEGTLLVTASHGEEDIISVITKGGLAGAMGFIDGQGHSASLRSRGMTDVLSLKREDLEAMLFTEPQLVYAVMRAVIRSVHGIVRNMNQQYLQLTHYISKTGGRY